MQENPVEAALFLLAWNQNVFDFSVHKFYNRIEHTMPKKLKYRRKTMGMMGRFFSADSPLMAYLTKLRDWMILSILWLVCSIPVITVGVSTAAMYYVTLKMAKKEEISIFKSFFRSFKDNFKQGVLLTLIVLVVGIILLSDCLYFSRVAGLKGAILTGVFGAISVCCLAVVLYVFPFMAQFSNTISGILKSAVVLAIRNIRRTGIVLVFHVIPVVLRFAAYEVFMSLFPVWLFVAPGAIAYLCSTCHVKSFEPLIQAIRSKQEQAAED